MARSPRIAYRKMREINDDDDDEGIGDQSLEEIKVTDVRIGDLLVVRAGDLIPVDGTIISGRAQIDESALTGEPLPKNKDVSDDVFSGTINAGGNAFEILASKVSEDSQYAKIVQLVRKAQEEKAPIQRLADSLGGRRHPRGGGVDGRGLPRQGGLDSSTPQDRQGPYTVQGHGEFPGHPADQVRAHPGVLGAEAWPQG